MKSAGIGVRGSGFGTTHGIGRGGGLRGVMWAVCVGTSGLVCATTLEAQGTIASRVAAAPDGEVRMAFAARSGICGEGDCISTHHGQTRYSSDERRYSSDVEWDVECQDGPVRVVLNVRDHTPVTLHTYVGGRWRQPTGGMTVTDLGMVGANDAANYLVEFARTSAASVGSDAIFPATLADSATIWPGLVALARDASRPHRTREQAVFWLGQAAADVTASLDSLAADETVDEQVREQAVFALSQRPQDQGVPILIQIAKTNHDPNIRRKALFWLGQSGDPRAIDLFEQILTKN